MKMDNMLLATSHNQSFYVVFPNLNIPDSVTSLNHPPDLGHKIVIN